MYKLKYYDIVVNIEKIFFKRNDYFLAKLDKSYKSKEMGSVGWSNNAVKELQLPDGIYYYFHVSFLDKITKSRDLNMEIE